MKKEKRTFASGAIRDTDADKIDPEGFLDPLVLGEFFRYMHEHRALNDGTFRASDNWQKGFPRAQTIKSMWRHFFDLWRMHRGLPPRSEDCLETYRQMGKQDAQIEALCAIIFGAQAYMREVILCRHIKEEAAKSAK